MLHSCVYLRKDPKWLEKDMIEGSEGTDGEDNVGGGTLGASRALQFQLLSASTLESEIEWSTPPLCKQQTRNRERKLAAN